MICQKREIDLLLYGLGELSPGRRLITAWHLLRCADCRARRAGLEGASREFARALRPPAGTPTVSGRNVFRHSVHRAPVWLIAMLAIIVLMLSLLAVQMVARRGVTSAVRQQMDGCSPGLPSDRCR